MKPKKSKPPEDKPRGCRRCKGQPWVQDEGGVRRCTCPSGIWYQQQERERKLKQTMLDLK